MSAISQAQPHQLDSIVQENLLDSQHTDEISTLMDEPLEVSESPSSMIFESDVIKTEELIKRSRQEDIQDNTVTLTLNLWAIVRKSAINLVLPFINGMMLGFGEILAHEIGFRYNWIGAKVQPPRRLVKKNESSKFLWCWTIPRR